MHRFICYIALIVILFQQQAFSKKLVVEIDGATFRYDDKNVMWEMYYSLPDTSLTYKYENGNYVARAYFSVTIKSNIQVEAFKQWKFEYPVKSPVNSYKMDLLSQKSFILKPGEYSVDIKVIDLNDTSSRASKSFRMLFRRFPENKLCISDIQLARNIIKQDKAKNPWDKAFLKNSLYVIPNPSLQYISDTPSVYLYTEVYNAQKTVPDGYEIKYNVYDSYKKLVFSYGRERKSTSNAVVEFINLPLELFHSGLYYVEVLARDKSSEPVDSFSVYKKFFLINPKIPPKQTAFFYENVTFEKSEFRTMSEERIKNELAQIINIATPREASTLKELKTTVAKQRALFSFWKSRDPDTTTTFNEARDDFLKLVDYANTYFAYGKMKDGWKTDRGRVLLKYGQPSQRDVTPQNGNLRAYETWFYSGIQGGISFNFVDVYGYGNYILVNSTAPGEIRNDDWYKQYVQTLKSGGSDNDIFNGGIR